MTAIRRWVRERLEVLGGYLERSWRDDRLETGTRYVWMLPARTRCLSVGRLVELDAWVEAAQLPGEAISQAFSFAVMEDAAGTCQTVPRTNVLWRAGDHA